MVALIALLLAYLGIAALWAHLSIGELIKDGHTPAATSLSPRQQAILLKIEDPTFLTHHGLSLADGQGVMTISSTLARDVFLEGGDVNGVKGSLQGFFRGVFACCRKVDFGRDAMALVLNGHVSKPRQLDLYVKRIYLGTFSGGQVRGLEQASMLYFREPLKELGEADFVGLVAMIKAPNQFHPVRKQHDYQLRRLRAMHIVSGACQPTGWFDTSYASCKTALD